MKRFSLRVGAALAVLCCALGAAVPRHACAQAAPEDADAVARAQAKEQFQAGVAAYEAQRHDQALRHFQEAYRIKPHPLVRVNIANCYDRLGKIGPAIFHFEHFLLESDPNAPQRAEVNEALRVLRAKLSEVTLRIVPDGASVAIDGGEPRTAPIAEPVRLEPGTHVIEVALSGYQTQKRDIVIEGGQRSEVQITLERAGPPVVAIKPTPGQPVATPAAAPAAAATPPAAAQPAPAPDQTLVVEAPGREEEGERPLLSTAAWVSGGATAAMFLGALITGQLALSAESDFEEARATTRDIAGASPLERSSAYEDALEAADRADALAVASDVFLLAGLVGAGVTVYFVVDHYQDGETNDESATTLTVSPTRVALSGRF